MLKVVSALSAAIVMGLAFFGSATDASAGGRKGKDCCGPIPPSYTYKTKKVFKNVTRHHDVYRTKYFKRVKPIVHVTRIQPVVRVHNVTRVHTKMVGVVTPVHRHVTQMLPAKTYVTNSVVHLKPDCGCSYRRY